MGVVLSLATCGVYSTGRGDDLSSATVGEVMTGARRIVSGQRAVEQKAREASAVQTRVQKEIGQREAVCADLRAQIGELNARALRYLALLKQPQVAPSAKAKASAEARNILRTRNNLESQLKKQSKIIDVARRALNSATTVNDVEADRQLMGDLAALTRNIKVDDLVVTELQEAGVEVIENTAAIDEHTDEINAALDQLNEPDHDRNSAFDLSHDDSLMQALLDLEAEAQSEQRPQQPPPSPLATKSSSSSNATTVSTSSFPTPASDAPIYAGANARRGASQTNRVAVVETTDGRFGRMDGSRSASSSKLGYF